MEVPKRARLASPSAPGFSPPDAAQDRREFDMLAYTGGVVRDWLAPIVWDLAGMKASPGMVILKQHDHNQICGVAAEAKLEAEGLKLKGKLYKTQAARDVCDLADQGFQWQASIGVENLEMEYLEEGETRLLNGTTHTGPMVVVTKSLVKESSFVPLGADGQTKSSVLSDGGTINLQIKEKTMSAPAPATLVELKKQFPKDPEFVLSQLEKGVTLLEARANYTDILQARLDARPPESPPDVPSRGCQGNGAGSAKLQFQQKFEEQLSRLNGDRGKAMALTVKNNKELHQQMLAEVNGRPLDLTGRKGA